MTEPVIAALRAAGCVFAEDEARLLQAAARDDADLTKLVQERVAGQPLECVLGWAEFAQVRITIEPGVFVPRGRSEFLVDLAVELAAPRAIVLDLCCGSGAIAAAVLYRRPAAQVYASDLDPTAVRCARRNLPGDRVLEGDLFAAVPVRLRGRIDLVLVNAPYVPTAAIELLPREAREYEPRLALDGGPDGLDVHRRIGAEARDWLSPGGHLLIETSVHQAAGTVRAMAGLASRVRIDARRDATVAVGRLDQAYE